MVDSVGDELVQMAGNMNFNLSLVASNEAAQDYFDTKPYPHSIVLDVSDNQPSGYAVCEAIKNHSDFDDVEVILVSSNNSIQEKLKGYDVGASDYLIKPIEPEELQRKLQLAIKHCGIRRQSEAKERSAEETALAAIMDASEQSIVTGFLRQSYKIGQVEKLCEALVEATQQFKLANTVQFRLPDRLVHSSTNELVPPLEEELLFRLKNSERIIQRGKRLMLNFDEMSLLVKNMPEDEEKCGRLRDHLALIMEGARSQFQSIRMADQLRQLIDESEQSLSHIQQTQQRQKKKYVDIMDHLLESVQRSFLAYGLTEEQENLILELIRNASDQSLENFDEGQLVDDEMKAIVEKMSQFKQEFDNAIEVGNQESDILEFF